MKEISVTIKRDERGIRMIRKETFIKGNDLNTARGSIRTRWLVKNRKMCPKCGSNKIAFCPGGTCYHPQKGINWICSKCLEEF